LNNELTAIRVAPRAVSASLPSEASAFLHSSWNRGDWKLTIAMPAVMLQKNISHRRAKRPEKTACRAVRAA
jgi:hypothetical protein